MTAERVGNENWGGRASYDWLEHYFAASARLRQRQLAQLTSTNVTVFLTRLRKQLGGLLGSELPRPDPASARVTGWAHRPGVHIERVILSCRPGIFTAALFMRPAEYCAPLPGILVVSGHNIEGKAAEKQQRIGLNLAAQGFAVLLPDPPGQGERRRYSNLVSTAEHNILGKICLATGQNLTALFIHDTRCALDYLLARPEVLSHGAGITGCSGGGQLSYFLFGLDHRITSAVPVCHLTTLRSAWRNEVTIDAESAPYNLLKSGGEREDFALAGAPKPLLVIGGRDDRIIDSRGTEQAVAELRQIYRLLGQENHLEFKLLPGGHGYFKERRQLMYQFFAKWYLQREAPPEQDFELLKPAEWRCAPRGKIFQLPGAITEEQRALQKLPTRYPQLTVQQVQKFFRRELGLKMDKPKLPDYRSPQVVVYRKRWVFSRYVLNLAGEKHPGAVLFAPGERPPQLQAQPECRLYVAHRDSVSELVPQLEDSDCGEIWGVDLLGTGELQSTAGRSYGHDFFAISGREYFIDAFARLVGKAQLAVRIRALRSAVELLRANGASRIHLAAYGLGALTALYALAWGDWPIENADLAGVPDSLRKLVQQGNFRCPQSQLVNGMLQYFDWEELRTLVSSRYPAKFAVQFDVPRQVELPKL